MDVVDNLLKKLVCNAGAMDLKPVCVAEFSRRVKTDKGSDGRELSTGERDIETGLCSSNSQQTRDE